MMNLYLDLEDNDSLKRKIDKKASDLFKVRKNKPQLQVTKCYKTVEEGKQTICIERSQDVENISELKALHYQSKNAKHFFFIRQEHSYSPLNISRELFEDLLNTYQVFPYFWKIIFAFGRKREQAELAFPGIRSRRSLPPEGNDSDIYESACVFRRVELHNRELVEGQSPWSIRQTGVYHQLSASPGSENSSASLEQSSSTFIFISPSKIFESRTSQLLQSTTSDDAAIRPWNIYRLLIAESLSGWLNYITWLEEALKKQSKVTILAKVGEEKEDLSPLTNVNINFVDRQNLKILEDYILDLQAILPTILCNIIEIREQCRRWCKIKHGKRSHDCYEDWILAEFDEYVKEVDGYIKGSVVLKEQAKSTAKLLSDLLRYEEAIQLNGLVEQSKDIATQTKEVADQSRNESQSMLYLAKQSTKDAAAVKILTVIGLIYLPSTIVSNFFSTQFVHIDENGNLAISSNTWILAVCVGSLTVITIALWWICIRCTNIERPEMPRPGQYFRKIRVHNGVRSFIPSKRGLRSPDLEQGEVSPSLRFGAATWSTGATTAVTGSSEDK